MLNAQVKGSERFGLKNNELLLKAKTFHKTE